MFLTSILQEGVLAGPLNSPTILGKRKKNLQHLQKVIVGHSLTVKKH